MYYRIFRWLPKSAFSRLMGAVAARRWPGWLLAPAIRLYVLAFRIDMAQFETPREGFRTFIDFFVRPLRPGMRPLDADPLRMASPVDGRVIAAGEIARGRLLQAKGRDYSLEALLGGDRAWRTFEGGTALTLYLSPRDYHRIHTPCAARVTRFAYIPGELWTVSPAGVKSVPGLFARNERLVSALATDFGEVMLVAVGATVVGSIRVVYDPVTTNRAQAAPIARELDSPFPLEKGQELGRFELGSTVILLFQPGAVTLEPLRPGDEVRMGQTIATLASAAS